ncbi:MAG: glycerophosphodiester phosphodiesterase [Eubacterium sp.]|nr:glycerophosphodiester phosphodiesterase [Eubacterium sp.]
MPEEKKSRWQRFKRFLKRNMTPLWAKRFSYQVISFLVSIAMVFGVASYAFNKTYEETELKFVDDFTITVHTGAFGTPDNSLEFIEKVIKSDADMLEVDVRQRPDGTVVMGHDIITTNSAGVELEKAFELIKDTDIKVNLDIKDINSLIKLRELVVKYGLKERVFMTGIEPYQTDAIKDKCPDIPYYINYSPSRFKIFSESYQQKLLDLLKKTGAIGINCNHRYSSKPLSNMLHYNGYKLSVWTVDKKYNMKRVLLNQPDNITTNEYDLLNEIIDNWGK